MAHNQMRATPDARSKGYSIRGGGGDGDITAAFAIKALHLGGLKIKTLNPVAVSCGHTARQQLAPGTQRAEDISVDMTAHHIELVQAAEGSADDALQRHCKGQGRERSFAA